MAETCENTELLATNQELQQKVSGLRNKVEEQRKKYEPTEKRLTQALEAHAATMVQMDTLEADLKKERAERAKAEKDWKAWKTQAEGQLESIQGAVLAEAEHQRNRETELTKTTVAAGEALMDQHKYKEQMGALKAENLKLKKALDSQLGGREKDLEKVSSEKHQNSKLRVALEQLMEKYENVAAELQSCKRGRKAVEFEAAELRQGMQDQVDQLSVVNTMQMQLDGGRQESKRQQELINRLQQDQLSTVRGALTEMTATQRVSRQKGAIADENAAVIDQLQSVLERCSQELQAQNDRFYRQKQVTGCDLQPGTPALWSYFSPLSTQYA